MNAETKDAVIEMSKVKTYLGNAWVHSNITLSIQRGEIFAIMGGSGSGKSTLLREILMLTPPAEGTIKLFGEDIQRLSERKMNRLYQRMGVMFQNGGLFSSLTLLENVSFPLKEFTKLNSKTIKTLALIKLLLVGLKCDDAIKYPAELSGGMQKRASIARALVTDPELLFFDEPTAGLDPESANSLDELILELKSALHLTVVIVTHDLNTLWRVPDRVAFLGNGEILAVGTMDEISKSTHPLIHDYFNNPRAKAAKHTREKN